MQPADLRYLDDPTVVLRLDGPASRGIHVEGPMRAPAVVVGEVPIQDPLEMTFVQDDDMVQALSADAADEPFNVRVGCGV
jgi:hypothetical protein